MFICVLELFLGVGSRTFTKKYCVASTRSEGEHNNTVSSSLQFAHTVCPWTSVLQSDFCSIVGSETASLHINVYGVVWDFESMQTRCDGRQITGEVDKQGFRLSSDCVLSMYMASSYLRRSSCLDVVWLYHSLGLMSSAQLHTWSIAVFKQTPRAIVDIESWYIDRHSNDKDIEWICSRWTSSWTLQLLLEFPVHRSSSSITHQWHWPGKDSCPIVTIDLTLSASCVYWHRSLCILTNISMFDCSASRLYVAGYACKQDLQHRIESIQEIRHETGDTFTKVHVKWKGKRKRKGR